MSEDDDPVSYWPHVGTVVSVVLTGAFFAWLNVKGGRPTAMESASMLVTLAFLLEALLRWRDRVFALVFLRGKRPAAQFGMKTIVIAVLLMGFLIHNVFIVRNGSGDTSLSVVAILLSAFALMINLAIGRWQRTKANAEKQTAAELSLPPSDVKMGPRTTAEAPETQR